MYYDGELPFNNARLDDWLELNFPSLARVKGISNKYKVFDYCSYDNMPNAEFLDYIK